MGVRGQPHDPAASTPGKDPVPILQEAGCAPGPVWTGGKFCPHRDSIPDRPARSQSLSRLSYPAHYWLIINIFIFSDNFKLRLSCPLIEQNPGLLLASLLDMTP